MAPTKTAPMPPDTERLTARIADLNQELVGIDQVIRAARQAFDADAWMRATMRADELPVLIREARADLYRAQLVPAWAAVDAARTAEAKLQEEFDAARSNPHCRPWEQRIAAHMTHTDYAEMRAAGVLATASRDDAERRLDKAKAVTDLAFDAVEQIEFTMDAASIDVPDGDGHHARPRPLARTITMGENPSAWALFDRLRQARGGLGVVLVAGDVPPRWVAHRLQSNAFAADQEATNA